MSATDAAIQKKMYGTGNSKNLGNKILTISNNDLNELIKIATTLEEHDILLKGTTPTIKIILKNKKEDFKVCY